MQDLIQQLRGMTQFLTTSEVMRLLKIRRNTVCDWVKTGKLPAIQLSGAHRFDPVELADWLVSRRIGAQ